MNEPLEPRDVSAPDDWIEGLLRADAQEHDREYLADDGFTARVMGAIPGAATLPAWRRPLLTALWGIAGVGLALALRGTLADLGYDALRLVAAQSFSLRDVGVAVLAVAAASWAGTLYTLREEQ